MKQSIKQRIEQLNNGEIPEGYKKTIVGICPIEWEEHTLSDFLHFKNGLNKEKSAFGSGTPIVNYTDVWKKRGLRENDIKGRVQLSKNEIKNYEAKEGDVFFTRTSETIDEIGFSSVLLDSVHNTVFSGFVLRGRPYNDMVVKEFNQYCYSSDLMRNEIKKRSSITTRALTSGSMLSEVAINLPTKTEQSKIAEILMKWDEAIELQEKLIDKLALEKRSALQLCFASERCDTTIRFADYIVERNERNKENNRRVKSISNTQGFVDQEEQFSKQVASENVSQYKIVKRNYVAYNPSRINVGSIAVFDEEEKGIISPMYTVFECVGIDPKFFLLLLNTDRGKYEIKSRLAGSVRDSLSFEELKDITMSVPNPERWQEILNVFELFDKVIQLEKDKLSSLTMQRKALQQCLLNGIVRV